MKPEMLDKVRRVLERAKVVFVATANGEGDTHIAAEEGLILRSEGQAFFRAWFCLKTLQNLQENPKVSLAVLDPKTKEGYQLLGEVERIEEGAILNGYVPEKEMEWGGYPRAEHQLLIRLQKISHLTSGAHSDEFN
jgi:general stress protein 26